MPLPVLDSGRPRVMAAADRLGTPVRWAHVTEIPALLRGGELVLTTGIGLPRDDRGLTDFLRSLAAVPVAALVVELGRAFTDRLPPVMVAEEARLGLPLIELRREVRSVEVTEAVHALMLDARWPG